MQEGHWTIGVDIGRKITQVSYMTQGMEEPETLETLFETGKDPSFLKGCLLAVPGLTDPAEITAIELVLSDFTFERAEAVKRACMDMGIDSGAIRIQGTDEACIYFALSQERSLWNNDVVIFDFSKEGLFYRNLHVEKGKGTITAFLSEEKLEGMDVCSPSDERFLRLASERMDKRLISAVYLVGEGFYGGEWAKESLKYLCGRRRVFKGLNLYTRGASYAAYDRVYIHAFEQVLFLCRNRLKLSVGIQVEVRGEQRLLYLARAGMSWYEARAHIEAVPDGITELTLSLRTWKGEERTETVSLEDFPVRERRMTRLEISLGFPDCQRGLLTVRDLGFGSMAEASNVCVEKEIAV